MKTNAAAKGPSAPSVPKAAKGGVGKGTAKATAQQKHKSHAAQATVAKADQPKPPTKTTTAAAKGGDGKKGLETKVGEKKRKADDIDDIFSSKKSIVEAEADEGGDAPGEGADGEEELDPAEVYAQLQRRIAKKQEERKKASAATTKVKDASGAKAHALNDDDGFSDSRGTRAQGRKKVDGMAIYTYDELNMTNASGGTPDCPFDCKCCF